MSIAVKKKRKLYSKMVKIEKKKKKRTIPMENHLPQRPKLITDTSIQIPFYEYFTFLYLTKWFYEFT